MGGGGGNKKNQEATDLNLAFVKEIILLKKQYFNVRWMRYELKKKCPFQKSGRPMQSEKLIMNIKFRTNDFPA